MKALIETKYCGIILLTLLTVLFSGCEPAEEDPSGDTNGADGSLVAFYKFEGAGDPVQDSTDNHNNGSLFNSAVISSSGYSDKALNCFGGNDHVEIPDSVSLDITKDITFDLYLYNSAGTANVQVAGKWDDTQKSYRIALVDSRVTVEFSTDGNTVDFSLSSSETFPTSEWVRITVVREGTDVRIFENGIEKASGSFGTALFSGTSQFLIGNYSSSWEGMVDEFRLYSCAVFPDEPMDEPPSPVTGLQVNSVDEALQITWNASVDAESYNVYLKDEDGNPEDVINLPISSVSYTYTGLMNGMDYSVEVAAIGYTRYDDVTLESLFVQESGVPLKLVAGVQLNTVGTSTGTDDPYDNASWSYNLKKVVIAWRDTLYDSLESSPDDHQLILDAAQLPIAVTTDLSAIELITNTVLDPGVHSVEAVIKDKDGGSRSAVQNVTAPELSGSVLYHEKTDVYTGTWEDFPDQVLVSINTDGDIELLNRASGDIYAVVDSSHSTFNSTSLKPASFADSVLTLLDAVDPLKCWELDFAENTLTEIDDEGVSSPIDLDAVCGKEVE